MAVKMHLLNLQCDPHKFHVTWSGVAATVESDQGTVITV